MSYFTGLGGSLTSVQESTWGTYLTTSARSLQIVSENLTLAKNTATSSGLRGGQRYTLASRRRLTTKSAGGDVQMDISSRNFGQLLTNWLGTPSPAATQIASSGVYRQIHIPGELSRSLVLQMGRPQTDGTVKVHSYLGCKVTSWQMSCAGPDGLLNSTTTFDAKSEDTSQTLITPSYVTTNEDMFNFGQLAVSLGGTVTTSAGLATVASDVAMTNCRGFSLKGDTPLAGDRYYAGAAGLKAVQVENGLRAVTGTLNADFLSQSQLHDLYAADTTTALKIRFTSTVTIGTGVAAFEILLPAIKFDASNPNLAGPDIVNNDVAFTAYDDGTNAPIQVLYESADSAV